MGNDKGTVRYMPPKRKGVSKEAKAWYDGLQKAYSIEDQTGLLLLQSAMEAFDRMKDAQAIIQEVGVIYFDRYNQPKPNPACAVERDSRSQMILCLKSLNLDLEIYNDGR